MSAIAIQSSGSGAGTLTIAAPITATNRTLTLPDATTTFVGTDATQTLTNKTMTSPTLTTPNIDSAQFATVSGTAPLYAARAWVNFNGTGTVAIRASGNVSSITDNGVGDYTVNFTTAMPDANYVMVATDGRLSDRNNIITQGVQSTYAANKTTTAARLAASASTNAVATDPDMVDVVFFR